MDNQDKILALLSDEDFTNVQTGLVLLEGLGLSISDLAVMLGSDEEDVFGDSGLVESLFLDSEPEEIIFKLNELPHGVYIAIWLLKNMMDSQDSDLELTKLKLNQMDWEYDEIECLPENIAELDSLSQTTQENLQALILHPTRVLSLPTELQSLTSVCL